MRDIEGMILDQPVGLVYREFAKQIENVPAGMREEMESCFIGDKSNDFYRGLLAGFAASHQMVDKGYTAEHIGCIIAFICDKMAKKEILWMYYRIYLR